MKLAIKSFPGNNIILLLFSVVIILISLSFTNRYYKVYEKATLTINDSARVVYYIDGKKVQPEVVKNLDQREISSSVVIYGSVIESQLKAKNVISITTVQNKNSEEVRNFSALITQALSDQQNIARQSAQNDSSSIVEPDNSAPVFALAKQQGESFAYILDPEEYNQEDFKKVSTDLAGKGFELLSTPKYSDGKLRQLSISLRSATHRSTFNWNSSNWQERKQFIVVQTNSATGENSITLF